MVTNAYGKPINAPKGVWFEFEDEIWVEQDPRRTRQDVYEWGTLVLTETYYRDILGFEPNISSCATRKRRLKPQVRQIQPGDCPTALRNAPDNGGAGNRPTEDGGGVGFTGKLQRLRRI